MNIRRLFGCGGMTFSIEALILVDSTPQQRGRMFMPPVKKAPHTRQGFAFVCFQPMGTPTTNKKHVHMPEVAIESIGALNIHGTPMHLDVALLSCFYRQQRPKWWII